jgi:arginase
MGQAAFYTPDTEPAAEAASKELAFATGRGPAVLADIGGRGPLVSDSDVAVFGFRDGAEQEEQGAPPIPPQLRAWDLAAVRRQGVETAARAAAAHVARAELDGFWIHLDADVLDDAAMPAVDYRLPGGVSVADLVTVLRAAMETGRAVGIEVTIYNPQLDPDGCAARELVHAIGGSCKAVQPSNAAGVRPPRPAGFVLADRKLRHRDRSRGHVITSNPKVWCLPAQIAGLVGGRDGGRLAGP